MLNIDQFANWTVINFYLENVLNILLHSYVK